LSYSEVTFYVGQHAFALGTVIVFPGVSWSIAQRWTSRLMWPVVIDISNGCSEQAQHCNRYNHARDECSNVDHSRPVQLRKMIAGEPMQKNFDLLDSGRIQNFADDVANQDVPPTSADEPTTASR
jgi:hypothetical protein